MVFVHLNRGKLSGLAPIILPRLQRSVSNHKFLEMYCTIQVVKRRCFTSAKSGKASLVGSVDLSNPGGARYPTPPISQFLRIASVIPSGCNTSCTARMTNSLYFTQSTAFTSGNVGKSQARTPGPRERWIYLIR